MPKSKKAGVSSPAGQQQQQHPKKHRKMASFAKLSTTTTTNPAKPKAAQSAHHQPGSGNAKNSNNDRKMKNSQQQQQQLQRNQRPIVPFGRKDRILLVGEGELGSSFLPILLSCALLPVRSMHALPYTFLILAFVPSFLFPCPPAPGEQMLRVCGPSSRWPLSTSYLLFQHRGRGDLPQRTMT